MCEFSTYLVEDGFQDTRDFPRITPLLLILFSKENTKCILNLGRGAWGAVFEWLPTVHMDGHAGVARWNSPVTAGQGFSKLLSGPRHYKED